MSKLHTYLVRPDCDHGGEDATWFARAKTPVEAINFARKAWDADLFDDESDLEFEQFQGDVPAEEEIGDYFIVSQLPTDIMSGNAGDISWGKFKTTYWRAQ